MDHRFAGYFTAIAAITFGSIESLIGASNQCLRNQPFGPFGTIDTNTGGHGDTAIEGADFVANAFGNHLRVRTGGFGEDDGKFLATIATNRIGCTTLLPQYQGNFFQHPITSLMSVGVVDLLEVVEVDEE